VAVVVEQEAVAAKVMVIEGAGRHQARMALAVAGIKATYSASNATNTGTMLTSARESRRGMRRTMLGWKGGEQSQALMLTMSEEVTLGKERKAISLTKAKVFP
jgi:alkyl sulfatase BDS1-like metallo-beta-lactamase superfamily hydrolase